MLKYSFYNIIIDQLNNGYLVYNSLSNGFAIIDNDFMEFLKATPIITNDIVSNKELKQKIEIAEKNGFLVSSDINEFETIKLRRNSSQYSSDTLYLTIATTMNCNFSCPYCYEKRNNITMNDNVIKDIVNFVKFKSQTIKYLNVTWYGGEPLLAPYVIEQLSEDLIAICNDEHISYHATIVTNGFLLDEKMAQMLSKCKVSNAQITLDGFRDSHNKRRNTKADSDSFSIITNNIDIARKYLRISIRANIDENNIADMNKLIDFCAEKEWKPQNGVRLYFSRVHEQKANEYEGYIDEQRYSEINKDTKKILINKLENNNANSLYPFKVALPCSAMSPNSLVIAPNGKLYKCWEEIDQEQFNVGDIKRGMIVNDNALRWLNNNIPLDCAECKLLPVCSSDCILRRKDKNYSNCKYTDKAKFKEIVQSLKLFYKLQAKGEKKNNSVSSKV